MEHNHTCLPSFQAVQVEVCVCGGGDTRHQGHRSQRWAFSQPDAQRPAGRGGLLSSPAVTGQMKKLVSVLGLSFQLQSLSVDSDFGVDVRQGSSAGPGLALGQDVGVPSAAG